MEGKNNSYKNLIIWQKSMDLVVLIYEITATFPPEEKFGLVSQMRRASVSIPSNIAEGKRRSSQKEFHHFLTISFGSGAEIETQLAIAKRLKFGKNIDFTKIENLLTEIMKMLNTIIHNF